MMLKYDLHVYRVVIKLYIYYVIYLFDISIHFVHLKNTILNTYYMKKMIGISGIIGKIT